MLLVTIRKDQSDELPIYVRTETEASRGCSIVHTSDDDSGNCSRSGVNPAQPSTYGVEPVLSQNFDGEVPELRYEPNSTQEDSG
jgi:hypothetical protein